MKNRDIFAKDPLKQKLVNEGVANVNDDRSSQALSVLKYELETFVCDGQYEKGLDHILDTYLRNIDQAQQPAVWVSGFYGSGKSHLVKMLRALWEDTEFPDGATSRGIASLPQSIKDHFKELDIQGKRHGGLHAASGTLGAGASGSVRLALLRVVFKSAGLPGEYPVAKFVMWLKSEGIYDEVKDLVEKLGYDWLEEIDNFYVAEGLHEVLIKLKPNLFSSPATCVETLNNLYPYVQDISNDQMVKAIKQALINNGKFPLTLIVLDEVQQFIGTDADRSIAVQEMVESITKSIGGKLIFIGTGQTAVTGTANLARLQGRFTVRIELSDADVEAVIRKVILSKKPDAISPIEKVMQINSGEIARHLSGTTIGHRQDDIQFFSQDYPILPVRRRFWENTLQVLDTTGTDSQLRNQLSMVHKVIQTNVDDPIGNVVPGDYIYFDSADKLLQARILPRKVYEKTMRWVNGSADERIMARACGLIFLINKLAAKRTEIGLKATADTIADLLVEDLSQGSAALRSKLTGILDKCEILMKVGEEYRIQTEESSAWNDEFLSQRSLLANEAHRIETERDDRIRRRFAEIVKKLSVTQGASRVNRDISVSFDSSLPADSNRKIYIWVRDGWSIDENSVRVEARQAGNQSPVIFIYIPKRSADDLRNNLIDYKAANSTLEKRGVPNSPEGIEAHAAIETTKQNADAKIKELLDDAFSGARVFQGGGNELLGNKLQDMVIEAAENSLLRLYPQFPAADRLLNLLAAAYGSDWGNDRLTQLLTQADHAGKTLETWLREKFFIQHCKLFQHRPFIWHIWDGLRDGFAALVNYHKLDYKNLETLIYTYLGDWISRQRQDKANAVDGAEEKLVAAENLKKRLELILKGEEPYDIFVRWKPIEKQPIGWNPDINDGVRLNIRPFMSVPDVGKKGAGVLRDKPNIDWKKDRGKDVESAPWYHLFKGDRINDYHLSLEEKTYGRGG